ncbi:MAG: hypothetical protein ACETVN_03585 [Asgard group archaeon]
MMFKFKQRRIMGFMLIMLFFFSMVFNIGVSADFHDSHDYNNDDDDDDDDDEPHSPDIENSEGIQIWSLDRDDDGYWLKIEGNKPYFMFKYVSHGEAQNDSQFNLRFDSAVEYIDTNYNGVIDDEEEIQNFEFEDSDESYDNDDLHLIQNEVGNVNGDNDQDEEEEHEVIWKLLDPENATIGSNIGWKITLLTDTQLSPGNFTMNVILWVFREEVEVKGTTVNNFAIKIDLVFISIPWISDNSDLAVKTVVQSEREYEKNEDEISTSIGRGDQVTGDVQIYFRWNTKAMLEYKSGESVNNLQVPVNSTQLGYDEEHEEESVFYLCYPHFNHTEHTLVHDPVIGVSVVSGYMKLVSFSVIAVGVIGIIGYALLRLRKSEQVFNV